MTKKEILAARDNYISLYQKNFNLYQETGEKRYYYAYCKYDDPCDVWSRDVEALDIAISVLKYLNDFYKMKEGD